MYLFRTEKWPKLGVTFHDKMWFLRMSLPLSPTNMKIIKTYSRLAGHILTQLGNLRAEYVEYLLLLAGELCKYLQLRIAGEQFLHSTWLNGTFDLSTVQYIV